MNIVDIEITWFRQGLDITETGLDMVWTRFGHGLDSLGIDLYEYFITSNTVSIRDYFLKRIFSQM